MNSGFGGGGFGQPATGGFGQATQGPAAGLGQPVGGGFGQPAQGAGFGQGAPPGGFGQPTQGAAGGFGQPAAGFGQAGGFGQQMGGFSTTTGFGQQTAAAAGGGGPVQAGATGGFGQQAGGFGQPATGSFGQQAGGFGQQTGGFGQQTGGFGPQTGGFAQAGRGATGGFGQPGGTGFGQQAGGFGQQAAGGFGQAGVGATNTTASGFGQAAGRGTTGGFGQTGPTGGFGQQTGATGGFGQQTGGFGQQTGGFSQAGRGATGGFGQPGGTGFGQQAGGFGQQAAGGFGQAGVGATNTTASGFGQAAGRGTTGGFGQTGPTGGFGQQTGATGGFGQQTGGFGQQTGGFAQAGRGATGGFGQPGGTGFGQQAGGFGQQAAGGFGQAGVGATNTTASGFGQAAGRGTTGGFGQTGPTGGFGQQTGATGGFGQQTGGFGQQTGGFGQQTGGFAQAGRGATGGFGQPGGTGFGQQAGGFGQQAAGGFGQAGVGATNTTAAGFGQAAGRGTTGGFGQTGPTGGFGQTAVGGGGFGQTGTGTTSTGGGFAQTTNFMGAGGGGGFGQAGRGTSFGTLSGGFGQQASGGMAAGVVTNTSSNGVPFLNLPDFAEKPYGNILLFAPDEQPKKPVAPSPSVPISTVAIIPASMSQYQQRMKIGTSAPDSTSALKQQSASFSVNGLSSVALRDLMSAPKVSLGLPDANNDILSPTPARPLLGTSTLSAPDIPAHLPVCTNRDYILDPPLRMLKEFSVQQLQVVHDFSIYRRDGKCSVHFLEPVNLVRCDISEVVALHQNGKVEFYPGVDPLPPLGHGLYVRARVTVNGVIDTTAEELRERCRKDGSIFDSYDAETGTWVYVTNIDADTNPDIDDNAEVEKGIPPDIEQISTYGESSDGVIHTPAPFESSVWYPQSTPPPQARSAQLASLARISSCVDQTSVLPKRSQDVSVRRQVVPFTTCDKPLAAADFELPYDLPDISEVALCERKGALVLKSQYTETRTPVYVVKKTNSKVYEMNGGAVAQSAMTSLGRSFRCGWGPGGRLAIPSFACLRDGTEGTKETEEVLGASARVLNPFFAHSTDKHYLQVCAISVLRVVYRYLHFVEGTADKHDRFLLVSVNLCRQNSNVSLSTEKLRELVTAIDAVRVERISLVEESTARQAKTVLNLLDALYGLPEKDKAENNAIAEKRYLTQLRRKNLNTWLKSELKFMDAWTEADLEINATQKLLCKLLCHKLKEAASIAKAAGSTELSRVLGICGEGNQFGSYVTTADKDRLNVEPSVRDRVISLLSGVVEPFVRHPRFERSKDGGVVALVPLNATWKQILGVFAFYGCSEDTSAEDIIDAFLERLRAPASRRESAYPPYADYITSEMLSTARGKDFIARGDELQDAALSILEGFTMGTAPPATALHPHASSYCATDYLTPFIIVVAVRAMKVQRTDIYKDSETKVLLGFAAALECLEESWFWALLPLSMIEDLNCRMMALTKVLRRNAYHFKKGRCTTNTDFKRITELLKIDMSLLEPEKLPTEISLETPLNAPSIRTHTSLHDALDRFSQGFCKQ